MSPDINISDILEDVIMSKGRCCGSIVADCQCGITHFVSEGDYEEGELEKLREQAIANPKKFIENGTVDYIARREFNAGQWVIGCPCNWQDKYARFIWAEYEIIAEFLKRCKKEVISNALKVDDAVEGI